MKLRGIMSASLLPHAHDIRYRARAVKNTSLRPFGRFVAWPLAAMAPWAAGCSLIFVEPTPPQHELRPTVLCTSSFAAPVLDTVLTGLTALAIAGQANETGENRPSDGVLAGQVAYGVLTAASAVYGYASVPQCRQARDELSVRVLQEQQALQRYRQMKLSPPPIPTALPPAGSTEPNAEAPQP